MNKTDIVENRVQNILAKHHEMTKRVIGPLPFKIKFVRRQAPKYRQTLADEARRLYTNYKNTILVSDRIANIPGYDGNLSQQMWDIMDLSFLLQSRYSMSAELIKLYQAYSKETFTALLGLIYELGIPKNRISINQLPRMADFIYHIETVLDQINPTTRRFLVQLMSALYSVITWSSWEGRHPNFALFYTMIMHYEDLPRLLEESDAAKKAAAGRINAIVIDANRGNIRLDPLPTVNTAPTATPQTFDLDEDLMRANQTLPELPTNVTFEQPPLIDQFESLLDKIMGLK